MAARKKGIPSTPAPTPAPGPASKPAAAQSMSNPLQLERMRNAQRSKTASSHTALFGSSFQGGNMGMSPSNYTNPYTHNFPVDILERPQSRQEQIEWNVRWYRENPIVRRVIDLHAQLPLSKMSITKPSSSSHALSDFVHQFFMDMTRRLQLFTKLRQNLGRAYWLHGDDFIFLEDQKMGENNKNDDPYGDAPSEYERQDRTNLFDVHRYVHQSSQKVWDAKYASVTSNPFLKLLPQHPAAVEGIEKRPLDFVLDEDDFVNTFGEGAYNFIKTTHTLRNASNELKKFVDILDGRRSSNIASVNPLILTSLGPEFLSYAHHASYLKQSAKTIKVAEPRPTEDEGPSDVDMALDPDKRPIFKLLGIDPVNVENIPRNDRSVGKTPNLDLQKFLMANPEIQKAIHSLPDPNNPIQVNETGPSVKVDVFGPDGVSPMSDTDELEAGPDGIEGDPSAEDDALGLDSMLGSELDALTDLPPLSPEDDPEYQEILSQYNKNLKHKKELLENLIHDLKIKEKDYRCFARIRFPEYKGWQAMRSLPPNQIEVARKSNSDAVQLFYIPSEEESATIHANLENLSEEAQDYWKAKKRLLLSTETTTGPSSKDKSLPEDGSYCIQVSNGRMDYELYGHGLIEACLRDLIHDDKIGQVKSQTFARNMQPKRLISAEGVDDGVLQNLQQMVDASTVDPDVSILTNYPVTWSEMGAETRLQNFEGEYAHIASNLSAGLAFFQEFITGQTTYSGSKTPQEIMNTMYLGFREDISFFIEEKIFRPVAERKGFYDVDEFGNKILIYPKISFSRLALRDQGETYDMLLNLYMKGSVSISRIYEILNIDEEEETLKLREELFTFKDPKFTTLMDNIYQQVAQNLVERTDITQVIATNLGLTYKPEEEESSDDSGLPI